MLNLIRVYNVPSFRITKIFSFQKLIYVFIIIIYVSSYTNVVLIKLYEIFEQ